MWFQDICIDHIIIIIILIYFYIYETSSDRMHRRTVPFWSIRVRSQVWQLETCYLIKLVVKKSYIYTNRIFTQIIFIWKVILFCTQLGVIGVVRLSSCKFGRVPGNRYLAVTTCYPGQVLPDSLVPDIFKNSYPPHLSFFCHKVHHSLFYYSFKYISKYLLQCDGPIYFFKNVILISLVVVYINKFWA